MGRLEFQKGNVEAALCVFDGIDLQAAIERFQPSSSKKTTEATLVLEAIYLKALSLQKLGKSIGNKIALYRCLSFKKEIALYHHCVLQK